MLKYVYLIFFVLFCSCSFLDTNKNKNNPSYKVAAGNYCKDGCIWSTWAVTMGAQKKEQQCYSGPCACVISGDIHILCIEEENEDQGVDGYISEDPNSEVEYDLFTGQKLATEAYIEATARNTVGRCYNAVADAVERITGPFLWGSSAYMAADQFASSTDFFEVYYKDLRYLQSGAIVIWEKGNSPHGHISVAIGDGREASDHVATQMTYHHGGGKARVFLPKRIVR